VEEGIVPGGGVAYIRALSALEKLQLGGDRQVGVNIIQRALEEPLRMIATNAGSEGATVLQRVKAESGTTGYDASSDRYVDMVAQGIIDPTKVTRIALQNAASVAALLLTTEALITELPEEKKPAMPPGGHHDMDMDY
jgi:chaperonin GroEL